MSDTDLAFRATLDTSGWASGAQRMQSDLGQMGLKTNAATASLGPLGTTLATLANPMTAVALGITAVGGALLGSVQAAASWESAMTGVAKTTGLAGPDLQALSQELLQMSTSMPVAASELANIAQVAGSLGVSKENISGFVEVASQMAVGFEMTAEAAATSAAKILTAYGQPIDSSSMERLGSVVNAMGDNFAATEPQVLEFLNRASFLQTTMGQTVPQIAALGTILISAGMDAEVAATGLKSFLNTATSTTSKKGGMDVWAKDLGVSVEELNQKLQTDFNSTIIETADSIAAIEDPVQRFQAAVALAGTEGAPALLKLAGQQENYAKALGLTNSEWENAQSLQKTFEAQMGTVNSQWTMFANTINMAAVELGNVMLPSVGELLSFLNDVVKVAIKVGEELYGIGQAFADSPLADLWNYSPAGLLMNAGSAVSGTIWGSVKDWAGIGTEHAEIMAEEIAENEKLQGAAEEALQYGIDSGQIKDTGQKVGEKYVDAVAEAVKAGHPKVLAAVMTDLKLTEEAANEYINRAEVNTQSATSSWARTHKLVGSTEIGGANLELYRGFGGGAAMTVKTPWGEHTYNTTEDFNKYWQRDLESDINTGLPDLNRAELFGDTKTATRLKLTKTVELENLWDISGSDRSFLKFEDQNKEAGEKIGKEIMAALYTAMESESPTLKESAQTILDEIASPGSISAERLNLAYADLLNADYFMPSWRAQVETAMTSTGDVIVDKGEYLKDALAEIGDEAGSALKDHLISVQEQETLAELVDAYTKAGGDASDALIQAIKAQDWVALGKLIGDKTREGLLGASSLGVIFDYNAVAKKLISQVQEIAKSALQSSLTQSDQETLFGIKDEIEQLKAEAPELWHEMGGEWIDELINAMEAKEPDIKRIWSALNQIARQEIQNTQNEWQDAIKSMEGATETHEEGFKGSYIGPTSGYETYLNREKALASGLDPTEQLTQAKSLLQEITATNWTTTLLVKSDTQTARKEIEAFAEEVTRTVHPTVTVLVKMQVYADEIRQMAEDAILSALSSVRY